MAWILVTSKSAKQALVNDQYIVAISREEEGKGSKIVYSDGEVSHVSEDLGEIAEMLNAYGIKRCPNCGKIRKVSLNKSSLLHSMEELCDSCYNAEARRFKAEQTQRDKEKKGMKEENMQKKQLAEGIELYTFEDFPELEFLVIIQESCDMPYTTVYTGSKGRWLLAGYLNPDTPKQVVVDLCERIKRNEKEWKAN